MQALEVFKLTHKYDEPAAQTGRAGGNAGRGNERKAQRRAA